MSIKISPNKQRNSLKLRPKPEIHSKLCRSMDFNSHTEACESPMLTQKGSLHKGIKIRKLHLLKS